MTRPLAVAGFSSLMECLLPRDVGEFVVGDLNEEFALRVQSMSRAGATWWFVMEASRSIPRLLMLSGRGSSWFKSLGEAAAAYLALGFVEPYVHRLLSAFVEPGFQVQLVIDLFVGYMACACGGFLSTWIHRGSALLYSVISTAVLASMTTRASPDLPPWFLTAFLVIALVAPIVGGIVYIACANRMAKRRHRKGGDHR